MQITSTFVLLACLASLKSVAALPVTDVTFTERSTNNNARETNELQAHARVNNDAARMRQPARRGFHEDLEARELEELERRTAVARIAAALKKSPGADVINQSGNGAKGYGGTVFGGSGGLISGTVSGGGSVVSGFGQGVVAAGGKIIRSVRSVNDLEGRAPKKLFGGAISQSGYGTIGHGGIVTGGSGGLISGTVSGGGSVASGYGQGLVAGGKKIRSARALQEAREINELDARELVDWEELVTRALEELDARELNELETRQYDLD